MKQPEREKTGIRTLKVGYNRVFGYYIEVSKSFIDQVPANYIRKQTLANCERYITQELKELENTHSHRQGPDHRAGIRALHRAAGVRWPSRPPGCRRPLPPWPQLDVLCCSRRRGSAAAATAARRSTLCRRN